MPIGEALIALDEHLKENRVPIEKRFVYNRAASVCMSQSYFQFRGEFFKTTKGTSIGNSLSPFVAEVFMAKLEMRLKTENKLPRVFHRYVDDIFAVVKVSELGTFLNVLNSQCESIQFTCETEKDNKLPFLDVELTRNSHSIDIAVYHKPTSTKRIITSDSFCPVQHKHAALHSMAHRLVNLPLSVSSFKNEYDYILDVARVNGYSKALIDSIVKKHSDKLVQNEVSTLFRQSMSDTLSEFKREVFHYVPGIMNKLKNCLKMHKMIPVYTNSHKLKYIFSSTKDGIDDGQKSGIYAIECGVCRRRYIGQTKRSLSTRYKEHCACAKNGKHRQSAFADHVLNVNHGVSENEHSVKLIRSVNQCHRLDAYESYFIEKEKEALNAEDGVIKSTLFALI